MENKTDTAKVSEYAERYVIKVHNSNPGTDCDTDYFYNTDRTYYSNLPLTDHELDIAKRYSYKTRSGAERSISKIKRYYMKEDISQALLHTKRGDYHQWQEKRARMYDWRNSGYTFSVITLEEMLSEVNKRTGTAQRIKT